METFIRPYDKPDEDTPCTIFCTADPSPDFVDLVQRVADDVGLLYVLVRKNANPEEYKQHVLATYPGFDTFLVYDGSDILSCYGVEEGQLEAVKMTVRLLRRYSLGRALGYDSYGDYMCWFEQYPDRPLDLN
ncbi:hypothetical protein BGZ68_002229 [Mortierella alpina]|nr:hypothetical protein BGZ68_002229 [Mortierella alpina]